LLERVSFALSDVDLGLVGWPDWRNVSGEKILSEASSFRLHPSIEPHAVWIVAFVADVEDTDDTVLCSPLRFTEQGYRQFYVIKPNRCWDTMTV